MRLVQITIPTGKREAIREVLEAEGVEYTLTDETSGREFTAIASFPLPATAVEPVMDRLKGAGLDDDAYTVVLDASTIVSRRYDQLEERHAANGDEDRIAREELRTAAGSLMPTTRNYLVLTIVSAIVATAGLLLDSAAVVVGSMVIAPLIGPALAASVGTVLDDGDLRVRGVYLQVFGIGAAVASATAFAALVQVTNVVPPGVDVLAIDQVRERLAPDFLALAIALGAGVAGALSLSTGVSAAIVGVMIAVALIPPAAVVGIGLAWGDPTLALGSGVLVTLNVLSINMAALAVLWYQGYRPDAWFRLDDVRRSTVSRIGVLAVAVLLLSVFLGGVTYASYQGAVDEQAIRDDAEAVVAAHDELELIEVTVDGDDHPLRGTPEGVVLTVGKQGSVDSPPIADALRERLDPDDVDIEVRFVEVQRG